MSSNQEWTLTNELLKLSGSTSLNDALEKFAILNDKNSKFSVIEAGNGWYRGGAETYIFKFSVAQEGYESVNCIIKACVAFSPGTQLENIIDSWITRRILLSQEGLQVPRLYTHGFGVLVEEEIAFSLDEIFLNSSDNKELFLANLTYMAAKIGRLGFTPIQPFSDLRSRGNDVVLVDFGQDLGNPNPEKAPNRSIFDQLLKQLDSWNEKITDKTKNRMYSLFQKEVNINVH